MTERKAWECDSCGAVDSTGEYMKQCAICNDDYCDECQDDHARDECGF